MSGAPTNSHFWLRHCSDMLINRAITYLANRIGRTGGRTYN